MLKRIKEKIDNVQITRYLFEYKGDLLPLHKHEQQDFHDTVIIRGSVKISGPGWKIIGKENDNIVYDRRQASEHKIEALEDNTEIINTYRTNALYREPSMFETWLDVL